MRFASVIDIFVKIPQIIHNYTSLFYFPTHPLSRKNHGCGGPAAVIFTIIIILIRIGGAHRSNAGASIRYFSRLDEKCHVMNPP